jgi:hypothetical protein
MAEAEATLRGQLITMRMKGRQTIMGGCCTRCMLYSEYAVLSLCWTRSMWYSVCAILGPNHDHDMMSFRGMTLLCVAR